MIECRRWALDTGIVTGGAASMARVNILRSRVEAGAAMMGHLTIDDVDF
jgi:hypothetical protein